MTVRPGPAGMRRAVVERDGHIYSVNHAGHGYVRSGYSYRGHEYGVRRYYVAGAYETRFYRPYNYGGLRMDVYAPSLYYAPAYYGWAYHPWAAPVAYGWGWGRAPWFGYYGSYFTPFPAYSSGPLWLTDFVVATTLEAAYRERMESAGAASQPSEPARSALSPDVKMLIADEVRRQITLENTESQLRSEGDSVEGVSELLRDGNRHVLLSSNNIDVTTNYGRECVIGQGDAIEVLSPQHLSSEPVARARVLAVAGGTCSSNSVVGVPLGDLQEMQNHLRATIDQGLRQMQTAPGLPQPPASAMAAPAASDFTSAAPTAESNEAARLRQLNDEAASIEQAAAAARPQPAMMASSSSPSSDLEIGMTSKQVERAMGPPTNKVKSGGKQIMTYPGVTAVFVKGRLAEIQ